MTHSPPPPPNEAPWHAQLFALTVHLNETGHFDWPSWATQFGATLQQHGLTKDLDGGDDYFNAWLETLEHVLNASGLADSEHVREIKHAWEHAYLRTPHGDPVHL
jgi:nitrile hydratase accessory protein